VTNAKNQERSSGYKRPLRKRFRVGASVVRRVVARRGRFAIDGCADTAVAPVADLVAAKRFVGDVVAEADTRRACTGLSHSSSLELPHVFVSSLSPCKPARRRSGRPCIRSCRTEHGVVAGSLFLAKHPTSSCPGCRIAVARLPPRVSCRRWSPCKPPRRRSGSPCIRSCRNEHGRCRARCS